MSGDKLTSEGTPHCCLFPKTNRIIILAQIIYCLQLKATWLFCVTQEHPWGLHMDTGTEALVFPPASFLSLCIPPMTTAMASLPSPGVAALAASLHEILSQRCYLCRDPAPSFSSTPHPLLMLIRGTFPAPVLLRAPAPVWYEPMLPQGSGSVHFSV